MIKMNNQTLKLPVVPLWIKFLRMFSRNDIAENISVLSVKISGFAIIIAFASSVAMCSFLSIIVLLKDIVGFAVFQHKPFGGLFQISGVTV